jgi:hypothetical protein
MSDGQLRFERRVVHAKIGRVRRYYLSFRGACPSTLAQFNVRRTPEYSAVFAPAIRFSLDVSESSAAALPTV